MIDLARLRENAMSAIAATDTNRADHWLQSSNPVKKRIGRLEHAWQSLSTWMDGTVDRVLQNFRATQDVINDQEINLLTIKVLLARHKVITEDEFQDTRAGIIAMLNRQSPLPEVKKEPPPPPVEEAPLSEEARDLLKRLESAPAPSLPKEAFVFGES